jgi:hypothetical protein
VDRIDSVVRGAVVDASKPAVAFAGAVVTMGALLSLLVPNIPPDEEREWSPEEGQTVAAGD